MRDKQQALFSWIVVALVVLAMIFPLRALFTYGRSPSVAAAQPTVAALLTQSAHAPTSEPTLDVAAVEGQADLIEALATPAVDTTSEVPLDAPQPAEVALNNPTAQIEPSAAEAYPAAVEQSLPLPVLPSEPEAVPTVPSVPADVAVPAAIVAPFQVQSGSPSYLSSFAHTELGCRWLGIAGQVFDADGGSRAEMVIFVSGIFEGQAANFVAVTGTNPVYGPGGYEIMLSDHLPAAQSALTVQLFDVQGLPMSEPALINLPNDCGQNLMLVNFQASFEQIDLFIPLVSVQ